MRFVERCVPSPPYLSLLSLVYIPSPPCIDSPNRFKG